MEADSNSVTIRYISVCFRNTGTSGIQFANKSTAGSNFPLATELQSATVTAEEDICSIRSSTEADQHKN